MNEEAFSRGPSSQKELSRVVKMMYAERKAGTKLTWIYLEVRVFFDRDSPNHDNTSLPAGL
jgi:hypothetical protein